MRPLTTRTKGLQRNYIKAGSAKKVQARSKVGGFLCSWGRG